MSTAIATWGNSSAVRLPQDVLGAVGLKTGDKVDVTTGPNGVIIIMPAAKAHRKVTPEQNVSFASIFSGYDRGQRHTTDAWPTDEMVGAERDAWAS